MKTAEEYLKDHVIGVNMDKLRSHHDFLSSILKAMESYAKEVAEKQRHDCQIEMNKRSVHFEGEFYLNSYDIGNTPLVTDN